MVQLMSYGMQIMKDGRLWASPDYTPLVLVQVIDHDFYVESGSNKDIGYIVQTVVPASRQFLFFARVGYVGQAIYCSQTTNNGVNSIIVSRVGNNVIGTPGKVSVRFYIFSDYVQYAPEHGIFFYREGRMVYCGNCLPLELKWFQYRSDQVGLPKVPVAVVPSFSGSEQTPNPPNSSGQLLYIAKAWSGTESGLGEGVYLDIWSSVMAAGYLDGCLYIETTKYDRFYKSSLGI